MVAEALSCVLFVPVDVIKERMQVQGGSATAARGGTFYRSTGHAIRSILKGEGISGIYRGYLATVGSFGPFSALYFAFYEAAKAAVAGNDSPGDARQLGFSESLGCAAAAGAAASVLTNPLDLVKLRLQVQRGAGGLNFGYRGLAHGLRKMVAEEGFAAMLRGAGTRVAFHAPTTAITMALFETCKGAAARALDRA